MAAVLLDTDVFSFLLKGTDKRAEPYKPHVRDKTIAISFVTVGELYHGAEKRGWGIQKRAKLETKLRSVFHCADELCEVAGFQDCMRLFRRDFLRHLTSREPNGRLSSRILSRSVFQL